MKLKILVITILSITIGFFAISNKKTFVLGTGLTKFIIIKDAEMRRTGILKRNAAILITDQKIIRENELLFLGNKSYSHACGYDYTIQFWASSDNCIPEFPFNKECEVFLKNDAAIQNKIRGFAKLLETNPTHYIYNLKIPISFSADSLVQSFNQSDIKIFYFSGKFKHHDQLIFTYKHKTHIKNISDRSKWKGEQAINEKNTEAKITFIINEINKVSSVLEQSEISFPMIRFGTGEIEHEGQVTLEFRLGTDIPSIKNIITNNGGNISSTIQL